MGILLLILKIIGCILLFLLCIILLILFAPVVYRGKGEWTKEKRMASGSVSWLWFVLRIKVQYVKDDLNFMIRILGLPIYASDSGTWSFLGREKKEKVKKPKKKKKKKETKKKETLPEVQEKNPNDILDLEVSEAEYKKAVTPLADYKKKQEEKQEEKDTKLKKIVDGMRTCYNKIKSIARKIQMAFRKVISVKELFEDEEIQDAVKRVLRYGTHILKITLPKKIKGWVHFGFDNPASTGKVLGVFGALIPLYGEHLQVLPDFQEEVLEGKGELMGRLYLIQYIILAIKIYLDKDLFEQKDRVMDTIGG